MGDTKEDVKLHGFWASPWARRVIIALKIKGISYEYLEEDLLNKSQLLLKYNPVKKLIPVLVHQGRPVLESLVIIEYIDETWKNSPKIFPSDPYRRAIARFWAIFIDQLVERFRDLVKAQDEDEEKKIIIELQEKMNKLEANVKDLYSGGTSSDGDQNMDVLDIMMSTVLPIIEGIEEAINIKFFDPEKFPLTFSWMKSLDGVPVVEETVPNHENMVNFLRYLRQLFSQPGNPFDSS